MEEHIEDPNFNVEVFAACANFKRTQFYTKVKQVTGISPVELLRKAHMEHAAKLLKETDLNIDDIRMRCGFSNSTTFYNYFKQHFGQTPRQYRQNCLAE
jgi:AraC-like DNA-binding protein